MTNHTPNDRPSWQTPNPYDYGGQPGPYTPPPAPTPPIAKKMPAWAKVLLVVVAATVALIGGCTAIVAGSGLAQQAAETQQTAPVPTYDPSKTGPTPDKVVTPTNKPSTAASPRNTHKPAPPMTISQQQAVGSAKGYLEISSFSRAGLIKQLSSEYGEGFSVADATFAVDHIAVDWNAQAARAAESYLKISTFSRSGLIRQLESKYGDGFTHAQAVYGADAVGLR